MTKWAHHGLGLAVGLALGFGTVSAQETVRATDGREILLHADGTCEIVDEERRQGADGGDGYRSVSLTDLKLDINHLSGERVEVTASVQAVAGMLMLSDPGQRFDTNPITAKGERLPRTDRARILEHCSTSGCRVTLQGEVKHFGFGVYGLELHRIVRD